MYAPGWGVDLYFVGWGVDLYLHSGVAVIALAPCVDERPCLRAQAGRAQLKAETGKVSGDRVIGER